MYSPPPPPLQLVETRDHSHYEPDSRDLIRLKNQIRLEMRALETETAELQEIHTKDMSKRKRPSEDVLRSRAEFFSTLQLDMARVTEAVTGHKAKYPAAGAGAGAGAAAGGRVITTEELMSGEPIAALNTRQERMTSAQAQQMAMIHEQTAEQDDLLDQISASLEGLQKAAHAIHDEVQLQNELIDDTLVKVDETAAQLDGVNDRVKEALKKVNSKSSTFCMYIVCFLLLLGLLTVLYNMIKG